MDKSKLELAIAIVAGAKALIEAGRPVAQYVIHWYGVLTAQSNEAPVPQSVFDDLNASIEADRAKLHSDTE